MAKKSDVTLEKRIAMLQERGVRRHSTTAKVADIVDVVGDLTLDEFNRLVMVWAAKDYVAAFPKPKKRAGS